MPRSRRADRRAGVDLVFLAGPLMEALWRGACRKRAAAPMRDRRSELEPMLLDAVGPGDVVMIKARSGSRHVAQLGRCADKHAFRRKAATR